MMTSGLCGSEMRSQCQSREKETTPTGQRSCLTAEVQDDLDVSVVWMLLSQGDVCSRGALGAGVSVGPQGMSGALQS